MSCGKNRPSPDSLLPALRDNCRLPSLVQSAPHFPSQGKPAIFICKHGELLEIEAQQEAALSSDAGHSGAAWEGNWPLCKWEQAAGLSPKIWMNPAEKHWPIMNHFQSIPGIAHKEAVAVTQQSDCLCWFERKPLLSSFSSLCTLGNLGEAVLVIRCATSARERQKHVKWPLPFLIGTGARLPGWRRECTVRWYVDGQSVQSLFFWDFWILLPLTLQPLYYLELYNPSHPCHLHAYQVVHLT